MSLLLHICCGPCACYSVDAFGREGHEPTGFWYNPNIHPYTEYQKRLQAFRQFALAVALPTIDQDEYALEMWLREAVANKDDRCGCCYTIRLRATAREAAAKGFDAFSTTLLYSRYQKHDRIKQAAQAASEEFGVPFLYRDLRTGWSEGIRISKRLRLYRQQYCGCIYSEKERYIDSVKR